jgi:hypothetical protein
MEARTGPDYARRCVDAMEGVESVEIRRSLWLEALDAMREATGRRLEISSGRSLLASGKDAGWGGW